MVESEEAMVRRLEESAGLRRETVLQPVYEDSVPVSDEDWELEQE